MTEKERMEQESIYNPNVSELTDEQSIYIWKNYGSSISYARQNRIRNRNI